MKWLFGTSYLWCHLDTFFVPIFELRFWGPLDSQLRILIGDFRSHLGILLGDIWESLGDSFGGPLGSLWGTFGSHLGIFWGPLQRRPSESEEISWRCLYSSLIILFPPSLHFFVFISRRIQWKVFGESLETFTNYSPFCKILSRTFSSAANFPS